MNSITYGQVMFEDAFVFLNQQGPFLLECIIRFIRFKEVKNKKKTR